jgi:hypothetical protein
MAITKIPAAGFTGNNFRNIIINGDMSIAQRGTSESGITSSGYYTVDRMNAVISSQGTWTQSQSTDVPSGQGFAKSLKMDCTTADASPAASDIVRIQQGIEGQNLQYLKYGTSSAESTTLSFWVKSNKTGTYVIQLLNGAVSKQVGKTYTISSADTWEKKTITFPGDTSTALDNDNSAELYVQFCLGTGSDRSSGTLSSTWKSFVSADQFAGQTVNLADSTSNEWYITGVQLEVGTTASDFEFLPFDVNLMRCERYYKKVLIMDGFGGQSIARTSSATGATEFQVGIQGQPMRTNPTASLISAGTPDIRVTKTLGSGTGAAFDGGNLTLNTIVSSDMTGKVIRVRGGTGSPDGSSDGAAIAIYNNGNTANAECDSEL